jgi:AcrR family transcriptional regulator
MWDGPQAENGCKPPHGSVVQSTLTQRSQPAARYASLAAARQLFAKRGYRGTSLASIAEAAGLSQPVSLLHHYPSKNALLLAVLASWDSEDWRTSTPRPEAPGIGIIDGLAALVEHNESQQEVVALFSMLLGEAVADDHPAHEYFVQRYERIRARVTQLLREAAMRTDDMSGQPSPVG